MINDTSSEYFAGVEPDALTQKLVTRVEEFYKYLQDSQRLPLWTRSYAHFNNAVYKDGRLNRVGEQGEYTEMTVNHFRNLLLHIHNMVTNQRPAFDARATNTDFKSMAQTIVANGILDFYNRYKGMDRVAKTAVEDCLQMGDGYVYQGWDYTRGDPYIVGDNGQTVNQGDILMKNFSSVDVIFDFVSALLDTDRQWYILRDFQNKWDLISRFPHLKDKILANSNSSDLWKYSYVRNRWNFQTDQVPVYIFIHDRTPSLPDGRFFTFVGEGCWLTDSVLPPFYKKLPVYRLFGSEQRNCGFGYSVAFDLLPIQEAVDGLYSTIITNQSTYGVQNIWVKPGSNLGLSELSDGLNLITSMEKPEPINLTATAPEIFQFLGKLESVMETISGVNSVARGNPDTALKSGTALALVQSMAIQFISGLQQSYATLLEDMGTGLINIMKANATVPRMIEIAGKNNKSYMKEFTSDDVHDIDHVTVDFGNPISRTVGGKVDMANNLLQAGMVENPQQYIQVLSTGKLEPLIEGKQSELMLIRSENEALSGGQQIQALMTDIHATHIEEHKCVLSSTEGRQDPNVVTATLNHIMEHIQLWRTADPALLMLLKEPPPPPPPMPMGMPPQGIPEQPQQGHPQPNHGQVHHLKNNEKQLDTQNPAQAKANTVRMPNLPKNPMTGQPNGLSIA